MSLLHDRRPAHVAGFVVAVGVNAIERMLSRRARTDVVEEGLEVGVPRGVEANATASVERVAIVLGVVAASPRVQPRTVLRGVSHAVRAIEDGQFRARLTTARRGPTGTQVRAAYHTLRTAAAATVPAVVVAVRRGCRQYGPTVETCAGGVLMSSHSLMVARNTLGW